MSKRRSGKQCQTTRRSKEVPRSHSRFLALPTELRLVIYEDVLRPAKDETCRVFELEEPSDENGNTPSLRVKSIPCAICTGSTFEDNGVPTKSLVHHCQPSLSPDLDTEDGPHHLMYRCDSTIKTDMLLVSRQVYMEALPILFKNIRFHMYASRYSDTPSTICETLSRFIAPMSMYARECVNSVYVLAKAASTTRKEVGDIARMIDSCFPNLEHVDMGVQLSVQPLPPLAQLMTSIAQYLDPLVLLMRRHLKTTFRVDILGLRSFTMPDDDGNHTFVLAHSKEISAVASTNLLREVLKQRIRSIQAKLREITDDLADLLFETGSTREWMHEGRVVAGYWEDDDHSRRGDDHGCTDSKAFALTIRKRATK